MASRPTRRDLLLGTAAAVGVAGVVGAGALLTNSEPPAPPPQRVPSPSQEPAARDALAQTEWVTSQARGRAVRLVTMVPPGVDRATLPVCVGLHGLGGNALWWSDPGNRRLLGNAWSRGAGPFALVAVDGGDNYWHPFHASDDPMRMLFDELPGWLRARNLGARTANVPAAVTGVSMGGTGALLYARERVRRGVPVQAVAALSPGLFTDWKIASRRPFAGQADWVANDPLRFYPELASTPSGVWCGDRDPFVDATRLYLTLARPEVGKVGQGRHDGIYYARTLPEVFAFLGRHLTPGTQLPVRPPGGQQRAIPGG